MSKYRNASVKRQEKSKELKTKDGKRLCRYCRELVKPPKRTICSDECLHQWKIRSDNKYMRTHVYTRDLGICALCNVDTRYTKIEVENTRRTASSGGSYRTDNTYLALLKSLSLTVSEAEKSLWHADHIKPVCLGGGEAGLDNIRTLCIKCHKSVTKSMLKSRRVRKKR